MGHLRGVCLAASWGRVVSLARGVSVAQGGARRESLPGGPYLDLRWLRALCNRLSHENRNGPGLTIEDQWLRRDLWEERARRAVAIAFAALYLEAGGSRDAAEESR